jgi:hypothetical protein
MTEKRYRPAVTGLAWGAAVLAALACGLGPCVALAEETAPAAVAYQGPWAVADRRVVGQEERGLIRLGDQQVLEIETSAGGQSGYLRSVIVATRLNEARKAGARPDQVHAVQKGALSVVQSGATELITVTLLEAARQHLTPAALAANWAAALARALGPGPFPAPETPRAAGGVVPTPTEGDWTPPETYLDKYVPVVSLPDRVKLGIARVNGPASQVNRTQVVARLVTVFNHALTINLYVPLATPVPGAKLVRVPGVGVTGVTVAQESRVLASGDFADLVELMGIDWTLAHYGGSLNGTSNDVLQQQGAAIEGETKVVPIVNVGSDAVTVGAAQVSGPAERVGRVQAVAQLDGTPASFRGPFLLPISTDQAPTSGVRGVEGVEVSAVIEFPN